MAIQQTQERKASPSIKVVLDDPTMDRIAHGPLNATGGRGAASWVRQLILRELDSYEAILSGNTQVTPGLLRGVQVIGVQAESSDGKEH